jgi:hypothetical protein
MGVNWNLMDFFFLKPAEAQTGGIATADALGTVTAIEMTEDLIEEVDLRIVAAALTEMGTETTVAEEDVRVVVKDEKRQNELRMILVCLIYVLYFNAGPWR